MVPLRERPLDPASCAGGKRRRRRHHPRSPMAQRRRATGKPARHRVARTKPTRAKSAKGPYPEIPNDDLLESIRQGEEEERSGKLVFYSTVEELMKSLE